MRRALVLAPWIFVACGGHGGVDVTEGGGIDVVEVAEVGIDRTTMNVDPCGPAACGPIELCGTPGDAAIGRGNGLDDNCNGSVDEGCLCDPNAMQSCFPGPPDRRNVGACQDGMQTCGELGTWGMCFGAVTPTPERCDGIDNNCDGRVDEDLPDCVSALHCPTHDAARPLDVYTFDGHTIDPNATAFTWRLECPAEISSCPSIADPNASTLSVMLEQSGRYVVHVTVTHADGSTGTCEWPLYVAGTGLRVELDWDTRGGVASSGTDMDLHVSVIDPMRAMAASWFTPDDCYYATCLAPGGVVNWDVNPTDMRFEPNTDPSACDGAPAPYGALWAQAGRCWNPRLDLDDITCDPSVTDPTNPAFCSVENVNVDVPPHDVVFRLLVNFFQDHGTCTDADTRNDVTHPRLLVYCAGYERAEIGGVEDGEVPMPCARNPSIGSVNWSWLAADVRFGTDACGMEDCEVRALRATPNMFTPCDAVRDIDDACADVEGRIFVRRAGARPVDADLPSAL